MNKAQELSRNTKQMAHELGLLESALRENKFLPKEYRKKLESIIAWKREKWHSAVAESVLYPIIKSLDGFGFSKNQILHILMTINKMTPENSKAPNEKS